MIDAGYNGAAYTYKGSYLWEIYRISANNPLGGVCQPYGLWAVDGTEGNPWLFTTTNRWDKVTGVYLNQISVGEAGVWDNNVYRRAVNSQKPTGVWWTQVIGPSSSTGLKLDQVDTFGKVAWGVYKGEVYFIKL
nr:hypothetical protein BaRGS_027455 [Batillaria attramentaria]